MRNYLTFALACIALLSCGRAQPHSVVPPAAPGDPPITILINPEARLNVALGGALPRPALCGHPAELLIKVINQALVTMQLQAELVGDVPPEVSVDFHAAPLRGVPEEVRVLHITLTQPGPFDLNIAFRANDAGVDLGSSERVHFLMHCVVEKTGKRRSVQDDRLRGKTEPLQVKRKRVALSMAGLRLFLA